VWYRAASKELLGAAEDGEVVRGGLMGLVCACSSWGLAGLSGLTLSAGALKGARSIGFSYVEASIGSIGEAPFRESVAVRSRELALVAFLAEADVSSAFAFAALADAAAFLEGVDIARPRPEIGRRRDGRDDSVSVHSEISCVSIF
jgi:hypothetical protein